MTLKGGDKMALKFVLGRAGSGKSEYILNDAIKTEASGKNAIIIVPEQYSHEREMQMIKKSGYICDSLNVTSFNRLAHKLISQSGLKHKRADDTAKAMMICRALAKCRSKLIYFKNATEKTGYIDLFLSAVSEFKKGQVMPETLKLAAEKADDALTSSRLSDISLIYEEYNKLLNESMCDGDDDITLLASLCFGNEYIKNSHIYIDEFFRFTQNEIFCIQSFLSSGADVMVCLSMPYDANTNSVFKSVLETKKLIEMCAKEAGQKILFPVVLEENKRFESPELKVLENSMAGKNERISKATKDISLFMFKNRYDEVVWAAAKIKELTKCGMAFNDIGVITGDYEGYKDLVKSTFALYDIPVFADTRKKFLDHPIVIYIFAVLDLMEGITTEKVSIYMKSGFCDITTEDAAKLENYALSCSINYNDWLDDERFLKKSTSIFGAEEESGEEGKKQVEVKNRILSPIVSLKEKISLSKNVSDRICAILEFIKDTDLKGKITKKADEYYEAGNLNLSDEYTEVYNIIIDTLETMKICLGDENTGLSVLKEVIRAGFSQKSIGIIPKVYDSVAFGDINRSVIKNKRALILLGVNEGIFPNTQQSGTLLSDDEREYLTGMGVSVAPDSKKLIQDAEFSLYESVNTAKEKLFVSYPIDNDGKGMRPAGFISKLKRIFENITKEAPVAEDELPANMTVASPSSAYTYVLKYINNLNENPLAKCLYDYLLANEEYKEKLQRAKVFSEYNSGAGTLSKETVKELYGRSLTGSVSRFERFSSCPFSFFVEYGLRAKERKIMKVEAPDIGSLLHEVVERFSKVVRMRELSFGSVTKSEQKEICNEIIDEMFSAMMIKKFFAEGRIEALKTRLKSLVAKSVWAICEHVAKGEFEPLAFELSFDVNGDLKPVTVTLPTGEEITMIGRIDRVDTFSDEGNLYIKVIDYKSGSKGYSLSDIFNMTTLQLSVYMIAMTENGKDILKSENTAFGGMFYFRLDDPLEEGTPDEEKDELKSLKAFKMSGLLADNQNVIRAMDKDASGWSAVIPVYIKNDGSVSKNQSKLADKEQYEKLKKYVKNAVTKIGQEIISGNIEIKPVRDGNITPCSYCKYRAICGFDPEVHPCRYTRKFSSDDEIWNEM